MRACLPAGSEAIGAEQRVCRGDGLDLHVHAKPVAGWLFGFLPSFSSAVADVFGLGHDRAVYEERVRALEEGIGSRDRTLAQLRDSLLAADVEYKKVCME